MTSIADLEKDVQRAKENLAYAERMLAEELEGYKTEDARGAQLQVVKSKHGPVFVVVTPPDGSTPESINLNPFQAQALLHYLAKQLGFSL